MHRHKPKFVALKDGSCKVYCTICGKVSHKTLGTLNQPIERT